MKNINPTKKNMIICHDSFVFTPTKIGCKIKILIIQNAMIKIKIVFPIDVVKSSEEKKNGTIAKINQNNNKQIFIM